MVVNTTAEQLHHSRLTAPPLCIGIEEPTVVGLFNGYGGAVRLLYSPPCRKNSTTVEGQHFYTQIAKFLEEKCIKHVLKHIYSTLMVCSDILKQQYFSSEPSLFSLM